MTPIVSVITPTFNSLQTLKRVYKTLSEQTVSDWEWIVINDKSNDGTLKYLDSLKLSDNRIKIEHNLVNLGVAKSRNKGLALANGKYTCFLDADDYWLAKKLETQINFMESNPHIKISYMDYDRVTEAEQYICTTKAFQRVSYADLLKSNQIGNLTSMCHKELIGDTKFIQVAHEDYVFWLELLKKTEYAYKCPSKNILCKYTVSKSSLSGNKFKVVKWQWHIYRKILNFNFIKSLFYTFHYIINAVKKRY